MSHFLSSCARQPCEMVRQESELDHRTTTRHSLSNSSEELSRRCGTRTFRVCTDCYGIMPFKVLARDDASRPKLNESTLSCLQRNVVARAPRERLHLFPSPLARVSESHTRSAVCSAALTTLCITENAIVMKAAALPSVSHCGVPSSFQHGTQLVHPARITESQFGRGKKRGGGVFFGLPGTVSPSHHHPKPNNWDQTPSFSRNEEWRRHLSGQNSTRQLKVIPITTTNVFRRQKRSNSMSPTSDEATGDPTSPCVHRDQTATFGGDPILPGHQRLLLLYGASWTLRTQKWPTETHRQREWQSEKHMFRWCGIWMRTSAHRENQRCISAGIYIWSKVIDTAKSTPPKPSPVA